MKKSLRKQNSVPNNGKEKENKNMEKRLTKSQNKMICGVCGGIAEYFNMDPTVVRLIFAGLTVLGFSGILLYIICVFVMPEA